MLSIGLAMLSTDLAMLSAGPAEKPLALSKNQKKELVQVSFNRQILELRKSFNAQVNAIAKEFAGHGSHYSANQIWNQVIFKFSAPKKTWKPMLPNAWAHAKAQAHCRQGKWFQ